MSEYVPDRWRHECRDKRPGAFVYCNHRAGHDGPHQGMGVGPSAGLHRWTDEDHDLTPTLVECPTCGRRRTIPAEQLLHQPTCNLSPEGDNTGMKIPWQHPAAHFRVVTP